MSPTPARTLPFLQSTQSQPSIVGMCDIVDRSLDLNSDEVLHISVLFNKLNDILNLRRKKQLFLLTHSFQLAEPDYLNFLVPNSPHILTGAFSTQSFQLSNTGHCNNQIGHYLNFFVPKKFPSILTSNLTPVIEP